MNFKIGDKVIHRKGGPTMTVDYIVGLHLSGNCEVFYMPGLYKGMVVCTWQTRFGFYRGNVFNPEDLHFVMSNAQQN